MPRRINILTTSHKHIHMCVEYIYIYYIYIIYIIQHQFPEFHSGFQGQLLQRRTTPRLPDPRIFQPNSQCVSTHGKCGIDSITEGAFQKAMGYRSDLQGFRISCGTKQFSPVQVLFLVSLYFSIAS